MQVLINPASTVGFHLKFLGTEEVHQRDYFFNANWTTAQRWQKACQTKRRILAILNASIA